MDVMSHLGAKCYKRIKENIKKNNKDFKYPISFPLGFGNRDAHFIKSIQTCVALGYSAAVS